MAIVATVVDGVWVPVGDDGRPFVNPKADSHVTPTSDIDQIVAHFAAVVRLAQDLSDEDQRRVRDFARATLAAQPCFQNPIKRVFRDRCVEIDDATRTLWRSPRNFDQ